jgi:hypothetical protein
MTTLPHTTLRWWTVVSHPLYTTDSALSDCQYFGPLKDALQGRHFADDDKLKQRAWGAPTGKDFTRETYSVPRKIKKASILQDTLCKNTLHFVKVVPIIYVNLAVSVIVVSANKETLLSYRPSYKPGLLFSEIFKNLLVLSIVVELCVLTLFFSVS